MTPVHSQRIASQRKTAESRRKKTPYTTAKDGKRIVGLQLIYRIQLIELIPFTEIALQAFSLTVRERPRQRQTT